MRTCPIEQDATPRLCRGEWIALCIISLAGLLIRLGAAWLHPFTGDEVGTWICLSRDYRELLTTFSDPWLSMGPYLALTKAWAGWIGDDPFLLRWPVVLGGAAAIPVMALAALRLLRTPSMALVVAALMALNPYLVAYSATARSYGLLVCFTAWSLHALLRWFDRPCWRNGWICSLAVALAWLSHANAAYHLAFLVVTAGCAWVADPGVRDRSVILREAISLVVPVALAVGLVVAAYLPVLDDMSRFARDWSGDSPSPPSYLTWMLGSFFAPGWLVLPSLILMTAGWLATWRAEPGFALLVALAVVVPIGLYAAMGAQHFPWGSTRFMIFLLPVLLLPMAWIIIKAPERDGGRAVLFILVAVSWIPGLLELPREGIRHPWRKVADQMPSRLAPRDVVVVPGNDKLALMPYLDGAAWPLCLPAEYDVTQPPGDGEEHLVLVMKGPWPSQSPAWPCGELTVTMYSGTSRADRAAALVRDVVRNTDGKAHPEWMYLLRDTLVLMKQLDWETESRYEFQQTYYHALLQHPVGQHLPPRQRALRYP